MVTLSRLASGRGRWRTGSARSPGRRAAGHRWLAGRRTRSRCGTGSLRVLGVATLADRSSPVPDQFARPEQSLFPTTSTSCGLVTVTRLSGGRRPPGRRERGTTPGRGAGSHGARSTDRCTLGTVGISTSRCCPGPRRPTHPSRWGSWGDSLKHQHPTLSRVPVTGLVGPGIDGRQGLTASRRDTSILAEGQQADPGRTS